MITSDFSAFAIEATVRSSPANPASVVQERTVRLMAQIAGECSSAGAYLIGNIKCLVDAGSHGHLAVSTTDPVGVPDRRGDLTGEIDEFLIKINVLLYGLDKVRIETIVRASIENELSFPGSSIELLEHEEHDHCHGEDHGHNH